MYHPSTSRTTSSSLALHSLSSRSRGDYHLCIAYTSCVCNVQCACNAQSRSNSTALDADRCICMLHYMRSSLDSKHVYPGLTDAGHSCQLEHPFQGTIWQPAGCPLLRAVLCGVSSKQPCALQFMRCTLYERCNLLLHIKCWHLVLDIVSLSHATHAVLMSHAMHAVLNHLLPSATRSCVF